MFIYRSFNVCVNYTAKIDDCQPKKDCGISATVPKLLFTGSESVKQQQPLSSRQELSYLLVQGSSWLRKR